MRAELTILLETKDTYTLREATEWFKRVEAWLETESIVLDELEQKAVSQAWSRICAGIAEREAVPAGYISVVLNDLARAEAKLLRSAQVEGQMTLGF